MRAPQMKRERCAAAKGRPLECGIHRGRRRQREVGREEISATDVVGSDGKVHGDLPPGRGVVDFGPYLAEIAALGMDGSISIELEYSPEPEKIVEWVTEAYAATDSLLRKAGIPRG